MNSWTQKASPQQQAKLRDVERGFLRLLRPPEKLLPSQWAERYRVIQNGRSREPGQWRNRRSPHLVGIMDAAVEPGVQGIVVVKGARIGYSEAWKNVLGYWIDCEPDPTMFVLPDKDSTSKIMHGDIRPLLNETPRLRQYLSDGKSDNTLSMVRLASMDISTGWAGSAQSLASSNQRRVLFDEVDKFPPFSGRDADPISLGMARANTYAAIGKAFYMLGSTPTTAVGHVASRAAYCTQHRYWHAPCPHCGHEQQMLWKQIKWAEARDDEDRYQHASRIAEEGLAWYECESCKKKIAEEQKSKMMSRGRWIADNPEASNRWVAFHAPSYISLMITWAQIAESWIKAQGDPAMLMEVVNQYLGEVFEERSSSTKPDAIAAKADASANAWQAPAWTMGLFGAVDVQKHILYYTIRAWGAGGRSQLVAAGQAATFAELEQVMFGGRVASHTGEAMSVHCAAIDARYREDEVMAWAQGHGGRVIPIKGSATQKVPITQRQVTGYPGLVQRTLSVGFFKDFLHGLIHADDTGQWTVHSNPSPDYCKQMASEHKVHDPKTGYIWQVISKGADNHWWDCEVYQVFLAQIYNVFQLTNEHQPVSAPETAGDNGWIDNSSWQ